MMTTCFAVAEPFQYLYGTNLFHMGTVRQSSGEFESDYEAFSFAIVLGPTARLQVAVQMLSTADTQGKTRGGGILRLCFRTTCGKHMSPF
jgi:hypothetical protein